MTWQREKSVVKNMCKNDNSELSMKNRRIIVKNSKFSSQPNCAHIVLADCSLQRKEKLEQSDNLTESVAAADAELTHVSGNLCEIEKFN